MRSLSVSAGRELSLRSLLAIAFAATLVPWALLSGIVIYQLGTSQQAAIENSVHERVEAIAAATDRHFADIVDVLRLLGAGSSLQRGDLDAFRRVAESMVGTTSLTGGLMLFGRDGTPLLEVRGPHTVSGAPPPPPAFLRSVDESRRPAVSDLVPGPAGQGGHVFVAVPVQQGARVSYLLATRMPAESLAGLLSAQHLPQGWIAALVDRAGTVAARSRDAARFVGRPANREFMERAVGERGAYTTVNLDGVKVHSAFRRLPDSGWMAAIGVLRETLVAPVRHSLLWLVGGGALLVLLAVGVATWAARRILGPLASLTAAARAIATGENPAPPAEGVRELTEIGRELVAATRQRVAAENGRQQIERQFRQLQTMETIGQLAAGMAHDVNNLLTVVSVNLELLQQEELSERALQSAEAIRHAVQSGERLTRQVLGFGQRRMPEPEPCDIDALLAGLLGLVRSATGSMVAISLAPAAQGATCLIDPKEFERAVLNIAVNARDAMNGRGTLAIRTEVVPLAPDAAGGLPAGRYVRVSFTDDGPGMSAEVLARAFEPFFTTKGADQGSGLGLSQVQGFARQSGGEAMLHSVAGEGTRVSLLLPLLPPSGGR